MLNGKHSLRVDLNGNDDIFFLRIYVGRGAVKTELKIEEVYVTLIFW